MFRMTTSVACKTPYVTPPPGQYVSEPVNVIVKGCDQTQVELNLMEITEVEYTHLQNLIQSHMEAQAGEEIWSNPPSSTEHESVNSCTVSRPATNATPACQPDVSSSSPSHTDVQSVSLLSNRGSEDSKEVLLYSDVSSISSFGDRTPCGSNEISSSVLAKMRCFVEAAKERNVNRRVLLRNSRPNPPARVCLEKRFNCDSCDLTKKQESQTAVLNTFLSMIHNSMVIPGIGMHSQPEKWPKAEPTAAIDCTHSYARNQGLGDFSQILEDSQHLERTASKNLSINQTVDFVLRPPCVIYTNEEQVINTENKVTQKAVKQARTRRARALQAQDHNIMHGSGKWKPVCSMAGRKPSRRTQPFLEVNERKERHNLKEKDRRRRIRLCCDELNLLVPFCYAETDKATTLQWTTAYLKYIREVYGDSLKQRFQNTFCGKTGMRMKPSRTNDAPECENSASKE